MLNSLKLRVQRGKRLDKLSDASQDAAVSYGELIQLHEDDDATVVIPVVMSLEVAAKMLTGGYEFDRPALSTWFKPVVGGGYQQGFITQPDVLANAAAQKVLFASYDLLTAVQEHIWDDLPHDVIAAASKLENAQKRLQQSE